MTNFLEETKIAIKDSGHNIKDVVFIGSRDGYECSWDKFKTLADFTYSSGYGAAYIPSDLIVVFSDGATMYRGEYDGSEWWEYSQPFVKPEKTKPIKKLYDVSMLWPILATLHGDDDE